jgi:hypothetical protein
MFDTFIMKPAVAAIKDNKIKVDGRLINFLNLVKQQPYLFGHISIVELETYAVLFVHIQDFVTAMTRDDQKKKKQSSKKETKKKTSGKTKKRS